MRTVLGCSLLAAMLMIQSNAGAKGEKTTPRFVKDPIKRKRVPANGKITITDYGYRDWGPELVHYTLNTKRFRPGRLALLDGTGKAVPFQIDGNTLTFVAAVPKGATVTYTLKKPARGSRGRAPASTLKFGRKGKSYEVRNEFLALRLPRPGRKTYANGISAARVTPPIKQWVPTSRDSDWIGGARFVTPRKVISRAFTIVRQGPACVEYEARYKFSPQGEYVWRLRLSPGMPVAIVTEEFDFGKITEGEDLLMLDLHKGWTPQKIGLVPGAGEQLMPKLIVSGYQGYVNEKAGAKRAAAPVGGTGQAPAPRMPENGRRGSNDPLALLEKLVPAGKWGGYKGGVQLYDGTGPGTGRNIGIVTLHAGSWRRAHALNVWHRKGTGVTVGLPLSVRYIRWSLDIADDFSPFSTHEHDRDLSPTYGRRVWGLYVGSKMTEAQAHYGYIGLDRYKDWILDWPKGKAEYPGAFFSAKHIKRLKNSMAQHPDRNSLQKWYLFSGRTEDAVRHAQLVINRLKNPYRENDFYIVGLCNYRKSQMLAFVNRAEDALACPDLPSQLRTELRRLLALYAHVLSEPDFNPREAGVHLGNNNMTINRTLALTYFAGLLPDHPRYQYWMDRIKQYAAFKFSTQTAVCGSWVACPSYQLYSPTRTLNITQNVLRNRGIHDFAKEGHHAATLRYLANLTMPDKRFGVRIIPGMGNSSNQRENVWGFSMAAVADHDPKLAGWFRYMDRLTNNNGPFEKGPNHHDNTTPHAMYYLPDVPENRAPLKTKIFPVYGVMFRAHFGNANETAMLFRAGMGWSHWDTDCLNTVLYGKGAPLSPGTGYQYYSGKATHNNGIYHNRVKVGRRDLQEVFGRVDDAIADYGFGPNADYAVADRYYPKQLFKDGRGEMHWRRHILFLKSRQASGPSYFVMRDTFPGGETRKKWWNWLNVGAEDKISVDGRAFAKGSAPAETFLPENKMPLKTGQAVEMKTDFGASTWFWFSKPHKVRIRFMMQYNRQDGKGGRETRPIVEAEAGPKQDFFYVVYPRKDNQPLPRCRLLAPGVMRITTGESQDTVFIGDKPFNWNRGGLVFTGKAGAIRVFKDRVAFCMNSGSGRIGYKRHILSGHGPFEQVVRLRKLRRGVHELETDYEKKTVAVDLGRGVKVSGEAPFQAELDGETIRLKVNGRARVIHVTQPKFIVRPQYYVDGQEWMGCWTDYPASGWGSYDHTWLIGLSVPAGKHELVLQNMVFPESWPRQFTPLIKNVIVKDRSPK